LIVETVAAPHAAQMFARIVTRPDGSVARTEQWVNAVLAHTPGSADSSATIVAKWTTPQVADLLIDLSSIRRLIRDPHTKFYPLPIEFDSSRGADTEIRYSAGERKMIAAMVADLERRGLTDADFVARSIVLHSDIAQLVNGSGRVLNFADGKQLDERHDVDHWLMARRLGDTLDSKSERSADLAFWYRATLRISPQCRRGTQRMSSARSRDSVTTRNCSFSPAVCMRRSPPRERSRLWPACRPRWKCASGRPTVNFASLHHSSDVQWH
jgi:hypothetical protein